ncbi:hypothetical protein [Methanospirillum sp.]|nr:hypothetical protein [Methanospirillum sp.]
MKLCACRPFRLAIYLCCPAGEHMPAIFALIWFVFNVQVISQAIVKKAPK